MSSYADYGLTPEQYHAGLDKLWTALGLTGVQDRDVFTLASERIMSAEWRMKKGEKEIARKVCARVYEELDDFVEEVQTVRGTTILRPFPSTTCDADEALQALNDFKNRLVKVLPFDPEEAG